ncbi:hypothetical protein N478_22085 [Pseudoalteromonas luteoviolacea S4060-1]|uniref:Uncharacterized protein n=1 Tax=Pseudoalteromonas luteoviolacea S4060-1 TaxID=1365257 RepID=A0A167LEP7_9GAMM|nr:hypothetical protein N478_22085 [Pseudoalteromonas luteoviolacea S4060-1]
MPVSWGELFKMPITISTLLTVYLPKMGLLSYKALRITMQKKIQRVFILRAFCAVAYIYNIELIIKIYFADVYHRNI